LQLKELTTGSLYGSDDNCERAKERNVKLIVPSMGTCKKDNLSLADFQPSPDRGFVTCRHGRISLQVKKRKRLNIAFFFQQSESCPGLTKCTVKKGKKYYYLRFTDKQMRIANRRRYEHSEEFKDRYR